MRGCDEVGPGTVHRAIEQALRAHFDPPALERSAGMSRWDRDEPNFAQTSRAAQPVAREVKRRRKLPLGHGYTPAS